MAWYSLVFPEAVHQMRGEPGPPFELAAILKDRSSNYSNSVDQLKKQISGISDSNAGAITQSLVQNLEIFKKAVNLASESLEADSTACSDYGQGLEDLLGRHQQLLSEHDSVVKEFGNLIDLLANPINELTHLSTYSEDLNIYNNRNADFANGLTQIENIFNDSLSKSELPSPETAKVDGQVTAADLNKENQKKLNDDLKLANKPNRTKEENLRLEIAQKTQAALDKIKNNGSMAMLYKYDPTGLEKGDVVIGIGDLDHAKNVAVTVQGIGTSALDIGDQVQDGLNLFNKANQITPGNNAVMVSLDYTSPIGPDDLKTTKGLKIPKVPHSLGDLWQDTKDIGHDLGVIGNDVLHPINTIKNISQDAKGVDTIITRGYARTGGQRISSLVNDFSIMRQNEGTGQSPNPTKDQLNLTLIGHSYGSTTSSYAASFDDLSGKVDNLDLLGSPGTGPVISTDEYGNINVYAERATTDPVSYGGLANNIGLGLGTDPNSNSFGSTKLDGDDKQEFFDAHTHYYDNGTNSLNNMAALMTGHRELLTGPNGKRYINDETQEDN